MAKAFVSTFLWSLFLLHNTMISRATGFLTKVGRPHIGRRAITMIYDLPPEDGELFNGKSKPNSNAPDKSQLYSNDELWNLLQVHEGLSQQLDEREKESVVLPGESKPDEGEPSLHDLVMRTVQEMDQDKQEESSNDDDADDLEAKKKDIIAIASDLDGTLLTSNHKLHPTTEQAIRKAVEAVNSPGNSALKYFFPATGKTREGALHSLGPEVRELLSNLPGVFIQGLYCIDADGTVIFEQKLPAGAIKNAEALGKEKGVTLLAYDGDSLYSNPDGDPELVAEIHEKWGEPRPKEIPSLQEHSDGFHKLLLVHQDAKMLSEQVRPSLESLAEDNDATVTVAVPTMLELLPKDCSKAKGVEKLCEKLGINPRRQLLAIGDAENDAGMLELAAIGVAVNNACRVAKQSADFVMEESNDEGGAGAAMDKFGPL